MRRKFHVKRISLLSAVRVGCGVSCIIGCLFGVFWGFILTLFSSMIGFLFHRYIPGLGVAFLFIMPLAFAVLYGILGTIASFLMALLYNVTAGVIGGIEVEIEPEKGEDILFYI